jgi:hypothetical protein
MRDINRTINRIKLVLFVCYCYYTINFLSVLSTCFDKKSLAIAKQLFFYNTTILGHPISMRSSYKLTGVPEYNAKASVYPNLLLE